MYRLCAQCRLPVFQHEAVCPDCRGQLEEAQRDGESLQGAVIDGHWRLEQFLGQGTMAWVYRGTHLEVGASVALKILKPAVAGDPALLARFRKEAASVSLLSHPHILTVMASGETPSGIHYMVAEYIHGHTLAEIIAREKKLPLKRATDIVRQILEGLEEAHAKGVVHRDLKPENIMVMALRGGGDFCKIVDFGIALRQLPDEQRLTRQGQIVGTPEFMAPEVIRGQDALPQSDLYAVGLIYYEMLTGELPFPRGAMIETLMARLNRNPIPVRKKLPSLPVRVETIIQRSLERDLALRFASAREFLEALQSGPSITTRLCPSCLQPVHSDEKFCPNCGRMQEEDAPAKPLPEATAPSSAALPQAFAVPFWGRDEELETVKDFVARDGFCLEVTGEPGVGRTMLVQEALQYILAHHGHRAFTLCPDNLGAQRPWQPWKQLLGQELGLSDRPRANSVKEACKRLGMDPEDTVHILALFGFREENDLEPAVRRREMITSVARFAMAVLGREPAILVCSNADRLDAPSREVLERMTRLPRTSPFHVLCTTASPIFTRQRDISGARIQALHLKRFSAQDARAFCQEVLGRNGTRAESSAVSRLVEAADGLPLHLVEGMRLLHEGMNDADMRLPDIIQLRVRNMQGPAHRFLQWLAAAGGRLPMRFVRESGLFDKDVWDALTICILHGFVISTPNDDVALTHDMYARMVLAETPAAVRAFLHQTLFERIRTHFDDPRLLCPHALHARNRDIAASYYERAGAYCRDEYDVPGALAHYRKAYELTEFAARQGQELQRFRQICMAYGELLHEAGRTEEAIRVLQEGQMGCQQEAECDRIQILSAVASASLSRERSQAAADRIFRRLLLSASTDAWEKAMELTRLADRQEWFSLGLKWLEQWENSRLHHKLGLRIEWERSHFRMRFLLGLGRPAEAMAVGEQTLKAMEGAVNWRAMARINEELVRCHMARQDFAGARARLQAALAALRFLGDRQAQAENLLRLSFLDPANQSAWAQDALSLSEKIGFSDGIAQAQKLLAPS